MKETRHSQGKFNIVIQHFLGSLLVKFEVTTTKSLVAFGGSAHHCFRMAPETAAASKKRKQTEKADESPQKKTKHDKASADIDKKKKKSAVDKKKTHTKSDKSSEQKVTTKAKKTLDVPTPDKASLSPIKTSQVSSLSLTLSFTIEILLLLSNIVCSSLPLM